MSPRGSSAIRFRYRDGNNSVRTFSHMELLGSLPAGVVAEETAPIEKFEWLPVALELANIEPAGIWALRYDAGEDDDEAVVTAWRVDCGEPGCNRCTDLVRMAPLLLVGLVPVDSVMAFANLLGFADGLVPI